MTPYQHYARARGRLERWAGFRRALPIRRARQAETLFWEARERANRKEYRETGDIVELPVPGLPHPCAIRPGTTDAIVYYDCLIDRQYTKHLTRQPHAIIDGGANIGLAALAFLAMNPTARIVAIECDEGNADLCALNLWPYRYQVTVLHAALWPDHVTLRITDPTVGQWGFSVCPDTTGTLPTVTPTECLDLLGGSADVVKLDVEGAEGPLLGFAHDAWLARVGVLLVDPEGSHNRAIVERATQRQGLMPFMHYRDVFGYRRLAAR
jgi:FkbM family methyltransferase